MKRNSINRRFVKLDLIYVSGDNNLDVGFFSSYETNTLPLSNHTNAEHFLGFGLQVFRHAGPLQR